MKTNTLLVLAALLVMPVMAGETVVCPGNIGSGSTTLSGKGPTSASTLLTPEGYDFTKPPYFLYSMADGRVAFQGFVDFSQAALANSNGATKFTAEFVIRDKNYKTVSVGFANDWRPDWYGAGAQP